MFSLMYTSDERVAFDHNALFALGEQCSDKNYRNAITGYLSWQDGRFFQFLEGDEEKVRALMAEIAADERHEIDRVVELGVWERRQFADWDMCFLDPPERSQARILVAVEEVMKIVRSPDFDESRARRALVEPIERMATIARENDPLDDAGVVA